MGKCECEGRNLEWCPCEEHPHRQIVGHCVVCGGQLDTVTLWEPTELDKQHIKGMQRDQAEVDRLSRALFSPDHPRTKRGSDANPE